MAIIGRNRRFPGLARRSGSRFNYIASSGTPFTTQWTVAGDAAARTITLPLVSGYNYNCVADWGDGSSSLVTAYNDANRIHPYASDGTYIVRIYGVCEGWSFNNGGDKLKITGLISGGRKPTFAGWKYLAGGFYGCTNLAGTIPDDLLWNASDCTNLASLLRDCGGLTGPFPADLLRYVPDVTNLALLAYGDSGLTGSIPPDFLRYATKVVTLYGLLGYCSSITDYGADLCRYNTLCTDFTNMMYDCNKMQLRSDTFYRPGEEATRFAGKSITFTRCFQRYSFTGTQGTAPDLWNCTYGGVTRTDCYVGAGNSLTSLDNYASIPIAWGGPA